MPEEKFTQADLKQAVARLAMLEYFPSNPEAAAGVMELLAEMVPHKRALLWLTSEMRDKIGRWHGPAELRGVLCTRFAPADGRDADCSIPGYRASDGEAKSLEQHSQLKAGGYLGDAPAIVKRLAAVKRLT